MTYTAILNGERMVQGFMWAPRRCADNDNAMTGIPVRV